MLFTHRVLLAELLLPALREAPEVTSVHTAHTGREALQLARAHEGAVCIVDPGHPLEDVFGVAQRLSRSKALLVFLADACPEGWVRRALAAGASAYLGKCATVADILRAIRAARAGQAFHTPCASRIIGDLARHAAHPGLTPRGLQVLSLLCEGRTSKEIARELGLSPKTIDAHRASLMRAAGVDSTAALVRFACAERFVDVRPTQEPPLTNHHAASVAHR